MLSSCLPIHLEIRSGQGIPSRLLVQGVDDSLGGCNADCFLLHLVICFNSCIFKDFLSDTLWKALEKLLHHVMIHWVVTSFVSDAFEFRDILIYLWPSHFQCLQLDSGSLGFLGVHEVGAEVSDELLVCGIVVISKL